MSLRFVLAAALFPAVAALPALGQNATRHVTGHVVDSADHRPVPVAQVMVTGTTIGAQATDSGTFSVRVPDGAKSLTVRRIGYHLTTVAINATGDTDVTVSMTRDVFQIDRQVITGVGTTISSRNAATHDPVITASQLVGAPTPTIENALEGKVPGALISDNSGAPGGGLQVQVRGTTSIYATAAGQPLYVVDGVIMSNASIPSGLNSVSSAANNTSGNGPSPQDQQTNRIADLNPNDIESMQFLEGSAASAIYGDKGASGVILITTKKGTAGKPQWDFTQRFGQYSLSNTLPVRRFTLPEAQAYNASFTTPPLDSAQVVQNYDWCHGFCDFQQSLYGNQEMSWESDLSLRGATPTTQYFVSGLTKYDNGAQINTGYNKQSIRTNVAQHVGNVLTASATMAYSASLARRGVNGNDNLGIAGYDVISYTPSFFDMAKHNADGAYVHNPYGTANAFDDAHSIQTPENVSRFTFGTNIEFKAFTTSTQNLSIIAQGGADYANQKDQFYAPSNLQVEHSALNAYPGVATIQSATNSLYNFSLSVVHTLTGIHGLQATTSAGYTGDRNALYLPDLVSQNLLPGYGNPQAGTVLSPFFQQSIVINQGFYAQEQLLVFGERLALTGGFNAERSSKDGNVNDYYPFPKASASYRLPNLFPGLDELKLRFAYGVSGTIPNYGVRFTGDSIKGYGGQLGLKSGLVGGDPNIKPETNTDFETGFDATLFRNNLTFSATVYQKRITDLLLLAKALPSSGVNQQWINGGQLTNRGIEMQLGATPVSIGQFTWVTNENFARNLAVVDNLPIPGFQPGFTAFGYTPFGGYRIEAGHSPTAFWGQASFNGAAPVIAQLGDANPAFTMGFTNDFNLGILHLHTFLDWRRGFKVSDLTEQYFDGAHNYGDTAGTAARIAAQGAGLTPYLANGDYLKLRELTLKVDLPSQFVQHVGRGFVRSASLSVSGRNLITWTAYPGLDPDVSNFSSQLTGRGQDVTPYPPTRSYFVSIDLGF